MPRAIDPNTTFSVVLKSDRAKPEGEQTVFKFRYPTGRQWLKCVAMAEKMRAGDITGELYEQMYKLLSESIVGINGELLDVVDPYEVMELLMALVSCGEVGGDDIKK